LGDEHVSSVVAHQRLRRFNGAVLDPPLEIAGHMEAIERGRAVPEVRDISVSDIALLGGKSAISPGDLGGEAFASMPLDRSPCLRVRIIDGHSVVDVLNAEVLFDWDVIRNLSIQLHRLVEEGHSRLVLNLSRIRYMSSDVLGTLATLHRQVDRSHGRLALFGLDPMLREMMRICCLEQVFDIYSSESEALGTSKILSDDIDLG
jgi:anti-sigma B factor antagonist